MNGVLERIGTSGVIGLGLLAFAAMWFGNAVLPQRVALRELHEQEAQLARAAGPATAQIAAPIAADQLTRFYGMFPTQQQLPQRLKEIYAVADQRAVRLEQGEYKLQAERGARLARYQMVFPLRGRYDEIRGFVGDVLDLMPTLALEDLSLKREAAGDERLDARIRFVLYVRGS
jgi:hypothetical protein